MKTKITILLFGTACFLFANNIARAQSSSALNSYNGAYYLGWSSANDLPFIINGSTYMTLKSTTGYFGLGTTSPLGKLDVLGGNGAASWAYIRGNVAGTKPSTASTGGLGIGYNYTNAQGEVDFVCNRADLGGTSGFRFQDWETTGSGTITDLVTIIGGGGGSNVGNTGIGTTTPASKLDVEGGIAVGATYSGTTAAPTNGAIIEGSVGVGTTAPLSKFDLVSTAAGSNIGMIISNYTAYGSGVGLPTARISFAHNSTQTAVEGGNQAYIEGGNMVADNSTNGYLALGTRRSNTITEAVRVLNSGFVGIGTIAPSDVLTVAGNVVPSADNSYKCGKSGQRWTEIWAVNGTIQTSDIRSLVSG